MKSYYILLLLPLFLCSCSLSEEEQLVLDYEQTTGNTMTDLNLKFKNFKKVGEFTNQNQADSIFHKLEDIGNEFRKEVMLELSKTETKLNKNKLEYKYETNSSSKKSIKSIIETDEKIVTLCQRIIQDIDNKDFKNINSRTQQLYLEYEMCLSNKDSVIAEVYNVTYSIINPILNNAKQTISKT